MEYYIDCNHITICYPYKINERLKDIGVLEQYRDKMYSLEEINKIIAELIVRTPYVDNSMDLNISVCWTENNTRGTHHHLTFQNYWHEKQKKTEDKVKFMFE